MLFLLERTEVADLPQQKASGLPVNPIAFLDRLSLEKVLEGDRVKVLMKPGDTPVTRSVHLPFGQELVRQALGVPAGCPDLDILPEAVSGDRGQPRKDCNKNAGQDEPARVERLVSNRRFRLMGRLLRWQAGNSFACIAQGLILLERARSPVSNKRHSQRDQHDPRGDAA